MGMVKRPSREGKKEMYFWMKEGESWKSSRRQLSHRRTLASTWWNRPLNPWSFRVKGKRGHCTYGNVIRSYTSEYDSRHDIGLFCWTEKIKTMCRTHVVEKCQHQHRKTKTKIGKTHKGSSCKALPSCRSGTGWGVHSKGQTLSPPQEHHWSRSNSTPVQGTTKCVRRWKGRGAGGREGLWPTERWRIASWLVRSFRACMRLKWMKRRKASNTIGAPLP